jgi:rhodanese-related sulfurtransferase
MNFLHALSFECKIVLFGGNSNQKILISLCIKRIQITKTNYLIADYPMADKITAKDVAEKKDGFELIDVREADEIAEDGTIEGAVNIPLGQLIRKGRQGELDDLKGKTICTYCSGGYRGNIGADELNKKGFTAVTIDGGYAAWKEEEKKKNTK